MAVRTVSSVTAGSTASGGSPTSCRERRMNRRCAAVLSLLANLALACTSGESAGPSAQPGTPPPAPTNPTPSPTSGVPVPYTPPQTTSAALPARTWLLTPEQYARAVQSFLGVTPDVSGFDPIP